jgi:methenyltetrahydrofolate cyclohydrolase
MSELRQQSIDAYLDQLAGKQATPGGGSVAALLGAQAAALTSMVCNLTLGKPKYAEVQQQIAQLLEQAEALRSEMTAMIKHDIDAFDALMACYALPKASDEEKALRQERIQTALKHAVDVPLACAQASARALKLSKTAAEIGNLGVVSDAGVAALCAHAALKSAALNVYINTGSLKDKAWAEARLAQLEALLGDADVQVDWVYQAVKSKL